MITTEKDVEEAIELSHFTKTLITAREVAQDVFPQVGQELKDRWIIERLMRIVKRKREQWAAPPKQKQQLNLPGFEDLPRRIFLRDGRRKLLDKATIGQVRESLEMLRRRFSPKIKQMEAVLALMEKYAVDRPKITWGRVKELESVQ